MFGYVNVFKDDLKIKDYKIFRAYYCGLCKSLGHFCGHAVRLGLSYDMVFLLLILCAVSDTDISFCEKRCSLHPFKKMLVADYDDNSMYVSQISCILGYLKCVDDFADDKSIKGLLGMMLYKKSVSKIKKKSENMRDIYEFIETKLKELSQLEMEKCSDSDRVADCFAKITERIFEQNAPQNQKRALKWIGYNIGRWIYLTDAFSDLKKDLKKGSYNPFSFNVTTSTNEYAEKLKESLEPSLTFTLSSIASTYELLDIKRNDAILRNIIYLGLPKRQELEFNRITD